MSCIFGKEIGFARCAQSERQKKHVKREWFCFTALRPLPQLFFLYDDCPDSIKSLNPWIRRGGRRRESCGPYLKLALPFCNQGSNSRSEKKVARLLLDSYFTVLSTASGHIDPTRINLNVLLQKKNWEIHKCCYPARFFIRWNFSFFWPGITDQP